MTRAHASLSLLLVWLVACKPASHTREPAPLTREHAAELEAALADASSGVSSPALAALLRDHWAALLDSSPTFATQLGVHAYDDRLDMPGERERERWQQTRDELLGRARAIDPASLDALDRTTLELFVAELESGERGEVCESHLWEPSNPLSLLATLADTQRVDTPAQAELLLARYREIGPFVDGHAADLRAGLQRGLVADAETLRRSIEMLERGLAVAPADSALRTPLRRIAALAGWTKDEREAFERALEAALAEVVEPALRRHVALLRDELLPAARDADHVGVGHLPIGEACYAARIQQHLSLPERADDLHALGLAEIARIDAEFRELGAQQLGTDDLPTILERLRSDPALYFDSAAAVESFARDSLAAAQAAAPRFFGRLPEVPCEVRAIPDYEAPFTYVGYYRQPADGQPGVYFVNTSEPHTRPRYEARVLAVHESVPGHHLQVALAQELPAMPAFRRYAGTTVFVEGWALYSERLAEEMGLYVDPLDHFGVLSFDAWRAARLVVDTGIHAKGWTRAQAIEFMTAHTALAPNNIRNEVDRYVGWPGQALGYKFGQLELLRLRAAAERALGERFDLPGFHDVVLGGGAVTLPVLRRRVSEWIASRTP